MSKNNQNSDKVLLVEGKNDLHVISALCKKYNVPETFEIKDCGGIKKLLEVIPVIAKSSKRKTIGVLVDADENVSYRYKEIKAEFEKIGLFISDDIPNEGLVVETDKGIRVGVWIMPNNSLKGMIEDFILFLVPKDDKVISVVDSTLDYLERKNINNYSAVHRSKAKISSWLAVQKDPGTPMGQAITKKYLDTSEEHCELFLNWLKALFC